jgi:hypothetical protein
MFSKLLIFLVFVGPSVFGQWHYGPKIDLSLTTVSGKGLHAVLTTGVQAGAFATYAINKQWSIQTELLFSSYKVKRADDFMTYYNVGGNPYAEVNLPRYGISLPVLLRYKINEQFSLLTGPQYSYYYLTDENLLLSGRDAFKTNEWSVTAGGEYSVGKVGFSLRLNRGLTTINNIDERYKWRSNHLQLGIAVKIR